MTDLLGYQYVGSSEEKEHLRVVMLDAESAGIKIDGQIYETIYNLGKVICGRRPISYTVEGL